MISLMVERVVSQEKAALDKQLSKPTESLVTLSMAITNGQGSYPLLKDLYKVLKADKQNTLATRLEKFVKGSLSSVFDSRPILNWITD